MNGSGCNITFQNKVLPPIFGVEMCVALLGNILALWLIVTKERKNWHMGVVFSCNLVISDIFYTLSLPLHIDYYSRGRVWTFGNAVCKIEYFLLHCNLYVSIYFVMCISVHRYLAIVHPIFTRKRILPKHAKIISVFVWIFVAGISLPIFYYSGVTDEKKCFKFKNYRYKPIMYIYKMFLGVIGFLVPFVVTFASYVGVISAVFKNMKITSLQKKKVALIVGLGCILYAVSFLPYHIIHIIAANLPNGFVTNCYILRAYHISRVLAYLNMCLHPILYIAVLDSMRAMCCKKVLKAHMESSNQITNTIALTSRD